MTYTVLGVDVSKWQGPMDWSKCKDAGARFALIRAGSVNNYTGQPYDDYQFEANAENAPKILPVGFYWYMRAQWNPYAQADFFYHLVKNYDWKLPLVLDLEYKPPGWSASQITQAAAVFTARLYERTQRWPMLYSRASWLKQYTVAHQIWNYMPLWIARYTKKSEPWGNPDDTWDASPPFHEDWDFWQWVADSNQAVEFGGAGPPDYEDDIDLNWFHGTEEDWQAYIGEEPDPEMPTQVMINHRKNTVLRSEPKGPMICICLQGQILGVTEEQKDSEGGIWYRVSDPVYQGLWVYSGHTTALD